MCIDVVCFATDGLLLRVVQEQEHKTAAHASGNLSKGTDIGQPTADADASPGATGALLHESLCQLAGWLPHISQLQA